MGVLILNKFIKNLNGKYVKIIKNKVDESSSFWFKNIYSFLNRKLKVLDVNMNRNNGIEEEVLTVSIDNTADIVALPYSWLTPVDFNFGAEINRTLKLKYNKRNIKVKRGDKTKSDSECFNFVGDLPAISVDPAEYYPDM